MPGCRSRGKGDGAACRCRRKGAIVTDSDAACAPRLASEKLTFLAAEEVFHVRRAITCSEPQDIFDVVLSAHRIGDRVRAAIS
ncbi:MAG: hypothetical protein O3C21_08070 [Verrucomicrobia bacterium]|nr:hypothetical protein [Verrucomicrobiota bacterium]